MSDKNRVITNITVDDLKGEIDNIICLANELEYKIDAVNFYENLKSDGYRGIHLYFKNNKKCYPIKSSFGQGEIGFYRDIHTKLYINNLMKKVL